MLTIRIRLLRCRSIDFTWQRFVIIIPLNYSDADVKGRVTLGDIVHHHLSMIQCHPNTECYRTLQSSAFPTRGAHKALLAWAVGPLDRRESRLT